MNISRRKFLIGAGAAAIAPLVPSSPALPPGWTDFSVPAELAAYAGDQLFFHGMPVFFDDYCPPEIYLLNDERLCIMTRSTARIMWGERRGDLVRIGGLGISLNRRSAVRVKFLDSGRSPQCPPNPDHPNGQVLHLAAPGRKTCEAKIPYPAPRCGYMLVKCDTCGSDALVTVAGRVDDPHTVRLECQIPAHKKKFN